jgi:DNA modification methylase
LRIVGDCREVLKDIPKGSVQTCVTSPPYWGLRDYGVKRQIGLERTPAEFVEQMVQVFSLVRDVLADDGTLWLNLGDSYARYTSISGEIGRHDGYNPTRAGGSSTSKLFGSRQQRRPETGLKPKDLMGMPWRVAFALQADGWYLRSDIIWHKPNPMPESVRDRPTKSHEYLFLLTKGARYFYDAEAVREPMAREYRPGEDWGGFAKKARLKSVVAGQAHAPSMIDAQPNPAGRNRRTVWTITPKPYPGAHFATFPPKLVEPCILAGTSEKGHCPQCGARWVRVVQKGAAYPKIAHRGGQRAAGSAYDGAGSVRHMSGQESNAWKASHPDKDLGFRPTCDHNRKPVPDVVLDPFLGAGTTAMVAEQLGRDWIGIEINPRYSRLAREAA